jgi:hypothetical protein
LPTIPRVPSSALSDQELTRTPLPTANAYMMIKRRAAAARLETKIGNHSFRAIGIAAYLKNVGSLENAAQWRITPAPALSSFTTGAPMRSPSMRSNGWGFEDSKLELLLIAHRIVLKL